MSQYFLIPVVQATINGSAVSVPKYYDTDLAGQTYSSIPYGVEGLTLVSTAPNAALAAESDVYPFPEDVTRILDDEGSAVLDEFLATYSVPTDLIVSGMPFVAVIVILAKLFLLAQYLSASQNSAIFTSGVTLSSPFSDSGVSGALNAQLNPGSKTMQAGVQGGTQQQTPLYDLSQVGDTDTVADVLNNVSTQFSAPISL